MQELLWTPSEQEKSSSRMADFMRYLNETYHTGLSDYRTLYQWTIDHPAEFWGSLWSYFDIICSEPYTAVVDDLSKFPGAEWFVGAKLNYAENMLRYTSQGGTAVVFRGENSVRREWSREEFYQAVIRLASAMRDDGVRPGDVVAGYLPNLAETMIAMLASAAIGAVWCSCATDIGASVVIDRIGQLSPVLLVTADGYLYKGKHFNVLDTVKEFLPSIPSIRRVIVTHYAGSGTTEDVPLSVLWEDYLPAEAPGDFRFEQLPASHPMVIMFSSGTTGKPKCMVQSAGGLLINQLKELVLHSGVHTGETLLYITTCSWMMWNWQASAIGTGAKLVLYDGNPSFPDDGAIWRILDEEQVTVFGLSASYIHALMAHGVSPKAIAGLGTLKSISQTGSALSEEGFHFVYSDIKSDLRFNSIAGGTDINGCFAIGNPLSPVYSGELQSIGLGMNVKCFDEDGRPIWDEMGELVCLCPTPSMPIYFWDDPDGSRYFHAYFDRSPGVWYHGDYVRMNSHTGGISFLGRSDSVLKPSGVRIGTAEIYNQVSKVPEIEDSLAVGQNVQDDQRIILYVLMKDGLHLTDEVIKKIKTVLRENASPRHVPSVIIEAPDLPRTMNGKLVESVVSNLVNGRKIPNRDSLQNGECLEFFRQSAEELRRDL